MGTTRGDLFRSGIVVGSVTTTSCIWPLLTGRQSNDILSGWFCVRKTTVHILTFSGEPYALAAMFDTTRTTHLSSVVAQGWAIVHLDII